MTTQRFEELLALLYVDRRARERFRIDPLGEARRFGLDASEAEGIAAIDLAELRLAAQSFERKRAATVAEPWPRRTVSWLRQALASRTRGG